MILGRNVSDENWMAWKKEMDVYICKEEGKKLSESGK